MEELTVDYSGGPGRDRRMPVMVVSRSGLATTEDLQGLLRRRLRFVSLLLVVLYGFGVVLYPIYVPVSTWGLFHWSFTAAFVVIGAMASLLWSRMCLSLLPLRAIEVCLFATLAVRLGILPYGFIWEQDVLAQARQWFEEGQTQWGELALTSMSFRVALPTALYIVAYAVFIPNTWRRCVLVVALLAFIPLAVTVIGYLAYDVPLWTWLAHGVLGGFLMVGIAAAMAVYGAHRIETLRQESAQARRLGQYVLRNQIGGGGMGEVHLADHVLLRRPCAIKLIRPEHAGDPAMLQRFEREVQATATLTHPNAIQIFDYGRTRDGTFYYVMEYLPGLTLDELVARHGPLPPSRAVHFLRQLCGALTEAHAIGLIHRDIKPGNVMICRRGQVCDVAKLLDFGLVHAHLDDGQDERLTQQGAVIGTPAFLSPEQAGGGDAVDPRSDIYSLGALAYFLLAGEPPFAGRTKMKMLAAHLYEPPAPLAGRRPDVPPALEAAILKCLAKDPADRFSDIGAFAAALEPCDAQSPWTDALAASWWQSHGGVEAQSRPTRP